MRSRVALLVLFAANGLTCARAATENPARTPAPLAVPPVASTPRIAVRDGGFVEAASGRPFAFRGVNYIRLNDRQWHRTFAPGLYDGPRADAMLAATVAAGLPVVRVFIDHEAGAGVVADDEATELSATYMDNVVDFLDRARRHRAYVVFALLTLPRSRPFSGEVRGEGPDTVGRGNRLYLTAAGVRAKADYSARFVRYLKDRRPDLLPTALAYELDNETHFDARSAPFSLAEGTFTGLYGGTYDLASEAELQRLADDHTIPWVDASVDAIRAVDPDALVSVNLFTFAAVGRSGPGALRRDQSRDRRFPARPLALVKSKIAYLDIHFYPFDDDNLDRDLASIEWPALRDAARARRLPLVMGEFGAFRRAFATLPEAADGMRRHLRRVLELGFVGFLYWTYDTDEQRQLWNLRSEDGALFRAMAAFAR